MCFCSNHPVLQKEDRKMAISNQETHIKGSESGVHPPAKDPTSNPASDASLKGFTHGKD